MDNDDINSFYVRLKHGDHNRVNEIVNELLECIGDQNPFPDILLKIIVESVKNKKWIHKSNLEKIVALTHSSELFALSQLDDWGCAVVFKAGYPDVDQKIELQLSKKLFEIFKDDANPLRREIVEGMILHGGNESLNVLKYINLELADSISERKGEFAYNSSKHISDVFFDSVKLESASDFHNLVNDTINAIEKRIQISTNYSIDNHKHRLSAWAASRAASVNGCRFKVCDGVSILEASGFDAHFTFSKLPLPEKIDDEHFSWRKKIIDEASKRGLVFSHGVAAKLINCYLKVRFVCGGEHGNKIVDALHPPVDDVLLKELAVIGYGGEARNWRKYRNIRWSKFDSDNYQGVVNLIRKTLTDGQPLWKIEEYWKGHQ